MLSLSSNMTPGESRIRKATLELNRLQPLRVCPGTHLHQDDAPAPFERVEIRLLLPTLGKPTTPTVALCAALGL